MASLAARPPQALTVGRRGLTGTAAGARLRIAGQRQIVSVIARRDAMDSLSAAVKREFGADLPDRPRQVRGKPASFLWCGHQQWFAMAEEGTGLLARLQQHIGKQASLSDQSDARVIVELSGAAARTMLAKLVPIDLHPRVFPVDATAMTAFEHVSGHLTHTGDDAYELMAFRSFADGFLHGILTAGAEFGIDVVA